MSLVSIESHVFAEVSLSSLFYWAQLQLPSHNNLSTTMETMTPIKCNRRNGCRNGIIRLDFVTVATLTLLLPYPIEGESPLAPIHGINLGSLHLNKRGGALATRKRNWRRSHPVNTLPHGESAETTEYWLEPVQKYVRSIFDGKAAPAHKAVVSTSSHKQQNKDEGLTTAAITCEPCCVCL